VFVHQLQKVKCKHIYEVWQQESTLRLY